LAKIDYFITLFLFRTVLTFLTLSAHTKNATTLPSAYPVKVTLHKVSK